MISQLLNASSGSASSPSASSSGLACSPSSFAPSATSPVLHGSDAEEVASVIKLLHQFERLQDQTFAVGGKLMAALVDARIERGLSATVGANIRAELGGSIVSITDAQCRTAKMHRQLETLARGLGIDPAMFGDESKGPAKSSPTSPFTGA